MPALQLLHQKPQPVRREVALGVSPQPRRDHLHHPRHIAGQAASRGDTAPTQRQRDAARTQAMWQQLASEWDAMRQAQRPPASRL